MSNKVSWKDTVKDVLNLGSDIRLPGSDMLTAKEKAEAERDEALAHVGLMIRVICRDFGVEEEMLIRMVGLEKILDLCKDQGLSERAIPQMVEECFSEYTYS